MACSYFGFMPPARAALIRSASYRALADYDKAIRLNPKNAAYYNNRRDAWLAKGDLARAIADANEARRLGNDNPN